MAFPCGDAARMCPAAALQPRGPWATSCRQPTVGTLSRSVDQHLRTCAQGREEDGCTCTVHGVQYPPCMTAETSLGHSRTAHLQGPRRRIGLPRNTHVRPGSCTPLPSTPWCARFAGRSSPRPVAQNLGMALPDKTSPYAPYSRAPAPFRAAPSGQMAYCLPGLIRPMVVDPWRRP